MQFFCSDLEESFFVDKKPQLAEETARLPHIHEVPVVYTQNLVHTCYVGTPLCLSFLLKKFVAWAPQYNPKVFSALIVRFMNKTKVIISTLVGSEVLSHLTSQEKEIQTKASVLIFDSGQLVCTGSKTEEQAIFMMRMVCDAIADAGYAKANEGLPGVRVGFQEFQLRNLVASSTLPFYVDLKRLFEENQDCCEYDPEIFPGVIMRHKDTYKVCALIFDSGKVVISGSKTHDIAQSSLEIIYPLLCRYQSPKKIPQKKKASAKRKKSTSVASITAAKKKIKK